MNQNIHMSQALHKQQDKTVESFIEPQKRFRLSGNYNRLQSEIVKSQNSLLLNLLMRN